MLCEAHGPLPLLSPLVLTVAWLLPGETLYRVAVTFIDFCSLLLTVVFGRGFPTAEVDSLVEGAVHVFRPALPALGTAEQLVSGVGVELFAPWA